MNIQKRLLRKTGFIFTNNIFSIHISDENSYVYSMMKATEIIHSSLQSTKIHFDVYKQF